MTQRIILLAILFSWLLSCRTTNKNVVDQQNELVKVKMFEVKIFNSVSQIKSIKENLDTVFLISPNRREYQIDSSKFIALRLKEAMRFRVGQTEQLGAYFITGNDTLWSGPSTKNAPKFYWIDENSRNS